MKDVIVSKPEVPLGSLTLGGRFSGELTDGYIDMLAPVWTPGESALFFNARGLWNTDSQEFYSFGGVFRYKVPNRDVIVGFNAYYDFLESQHNNEFHQAGFGLELLTRWFDARFNYYLPEGDQLEFSSSSQTDGVTRVGAPFVRGGLIQQTTETTTTRVRRHRLESALEGWNVEAGFLVPGLDRYMELRLFAGYYCLKNDFGSDFSGFKARAEARVLPGVILDAEYYDDAHLIGDHWFGGVRLQLPFDIANLARGRNPFEGAGRMFTPRQREFRERMSEMVVRSHRVKTVESGPLVDDIQTDTQTQTDTIGRVPPPPRVIRRPPSTPPPETSEVSDVSPTSQVSEVGEA